MSSGDVPPPSIASAPYQGIPPAPPPSSKKIFWILGTIVLGFFLLVVLIVGAIVATVFSAIRSSEPYKHAVTVAVQASRVQAALGAPIKQGLIGGGSIDVAGDTGNADLSIPIAGAHHIGNALCSRAKIRRRVDIPDPGSPSG